MSRGNAVTAWSCFSTMLASVIILSVRLTGQQVIDVVSGIAIFLIVICTLILWATCYDDLCDREFKDKNAKAHWATVLDTKLFMLVYLIYFSIVLSLKESSSERQDSGSP